MNMIGIIIAAATVGGSGVIIGIFLGLFGEKFKVEVDERELFVRAELPGNNCGGCGFAGCDGLAHAIAQGSAQVAACPVGGKGVADKIAAIMGVSSEDEVHKVAFVKCAGVCDATNERFVYYGIEDCASMKFIPNQGAKACIYGCSGFGTCVKVCPFDAIHVVDGIAVVDKEACKACGKCVSACPKHLIDMVPYQAKNLVRCSSKDKGKDVMQKCNAGCIGCSICVKTCEHEAVSVIDNVARINTENCVNCGACAKKCPIGIITGR